MSPSALSFISRRALLAGLGIITSACAPVAIARPLRGVPGGAPPPPTPPADYTLFSAAALQALVVSVGTGLSGKIIELADGDYGPTPIYLNSTGAPGGTPLNFTTPMIIRSVNWRMARNISFMGDGTNNVTLQELKGYLSRVGAPQAAVFSFQGATNFTTEDCEVYADDLATADRTGYCAVSNIVNGIGGAGFINGEKVTTSGGGAGWYFNNRPASSVTGSTGNFAIAAQDGSPLGAAGGVYSSQWQNKVMTGQVSGATCTVGAITSNVTFMIAISVEVLNGVSGSNITVDSCYLHDARWGVGVAATNVTITNNIISKFYTSPYDFSNDYSHTLVSGNVCIGSMCTNTDGQPSGTNGPHSSLGGTSGAYFMCDDFDYHGNITGVGTDLLRATGIIASDTGFKFNDQAQDIVGYVSGPTLTVTGFTGSLGFSTSWVFKNLQRLIAQGVPDGTKIVGTGTGNFTTHPVTTVTFVLNNSFTLGSAGSPVTMMIQARNTNVKFRNNIIDANNSIAVEAGFFGDGCEVAYNTIISCTDTRFTPAAIPGINFHDCDGTASIHHNTTMTISESIDGGGKSSTPNLGYSTPDSVKSRCHNNLQPSSALTTGPSAFLNLFQGVGGATPFAGMTAANALTMWASKAGGVLVGANIGHTAYYDWATGTSSYPANPPVVTSVSTGVTNPEVLFNGSQNATYTSPPGSHFLDLGTGNVLTVYMQLAMGAGSDGIDTYLMRASQSGTDLAVRRLSSNNRNQLQFLMNDSTGLNCIKIQTEFGISEADGLTSFIFSIDVANMRFTASKASVIDGLYTVSNWLGTPMRLTATTFRLFTPVQSATPIVDQAMLYITDQFIDLTQSINLSKVVALDNTPLDFGLDGHLLTGTIPRLYANGNAAAWNAGINTGSAAAKLIPSTPLVDA